MMVNELMTPRPASIQGEAPIREALDIMLELDVRHLPVVNDDNEVIGMISDRDLRTMFQPAEGPPELVAWANRRLAQPVSSLMSGDVLQVQSDDDAQDAIDLMLEHRVGALPVTSAEGRLVGIVSYIDVLRMIGKL
jgi:CBS domain-containing protein